MARYPPEIGDLPRIYWIYKHYYGKMEYKYIDGGG